MKKDVAAQSVDVLDIVDQVRAVGRETAEVADLLAAVRRRLG